MFCLYSQVLKLPGRPGKHSFVAFCHNRPLEQVWVLHHQVDQLLISQLAARYMFTIRGFTGTNRFQRFQACTLQKLSQCWFVKRMLVVVDGLKFCLFFGQDPPDLATLASCRLFVDDNL